MIVHYRCYHKYLYISKIQCIQCINNNFLQISQKQTIAEYYRKNLFYIIFFTTYFKIIEIDEIYLLLL